MTVPNLPSFKVFTGSGSTGPFSFSFNFNNDSDLEVVVTDLNGVPTLLTLDTDYTVFGEVVEGLDVIDKIAAVQTSSGDRPVKEIKMTMKVL